MDIILEAFRNVWVRRGRTLLNMVGVVISCVLLLCTLAGATGVRNAIADFVESSADALKFRVYTDYDRSVQVPESEVRVESEMTPDREKRVRRMLEGNWRRKNLVRPKYISAAQMEGLRGLAYVRDVVPVQTQTCTLSMVAEGSQMGPANLAEEKSTSESGQPVTDRAAQNLLLKKPLLQKRLVGESSFNVGLRERIILGDPINEKAPDEIVLHEDLAFELGFRSDDEMRRLVGRSVELKFGSIANPIDAFASKLTELSPEEQRDLFGIVEKLLSGQTEDLVNTNTLGLVQKMKKTTAPSASRDDSEGGPVRFQAKVGGIVRGNDEEDVSSFLSGYFGQGQLMIHHSKMNELSLAAGAEGVGNAIVYVDEVQHLDETIEAVKGLNLRPVSALRIVQNIYEAIERSKYSALLVGAIILLVAAVGISNTMIISLIERSEEIGIMKAVGASNHCITAIVLLEGLITGATGGIIAVLIASVVTYYGDVILKNYVQQRIAVPLEGDMFVLEPWMIITTIGSAAAVATLAGLWPARRAAKMDPIKAMSES